MKVGPAAASVPMMIGVDPDSAVGNSATLATTDRYPERKVEVVRARLERQKVVDFALIDHLVNADPLSSRGAVSASVIRFRLAREPECGADAGKIGSTDGGLDAGRIDGDPRSSTDMAHADELAQCERGRPMDPDESCAC